MLFNLSTTQAGAVGNTVSSANNWRDLYTGSLYDSPMEACIATQNYINAHPRGYYLSNPSVIPPASSTGYWNCMYGTTPAPPNTEITFTTTTSLLYRFFICPAHSSIVATDQITGGTCACHTNFKFISDDAGKNCVCPEDMQLDPTGIRCVPATYTLALTPKDATIEPGGSYTFTAMVLDQNFKLPSESVPVSIEVKVDPKSGGHDHGDSSRPKGSVSPASGNNIFGVEFKSTDASGTHTITATCDQCVNKTATAVVTVKVDGLETIPSSAFYAFIGAVEGKHTDNHYLTPDAAAVLWNLALSYMANPQFKLRIPKTKKLVNPPILHVNDASLKWGGRFDTRANWAGPHAEHMRGTAVDLRANNSFGAIDPKNFNNFDLLLVETDKNIKFLKECTVDKKDTPLAQRHNRTWPDCKSKLDKSADTNRHYHIRLKGVKE